MTGLDPYDPAEHDVRIKALAYEMGRDWVDDETPDTDELIDDIEQFLGVSLPDRDGRALTRLRRMVREKFNEGLKDDVG